MARSSAAWMQTYTGRAFYPTDPQLEDIFIEDIAHALSLLCRYGGHVNHFYSVAEHCVLMSYAVSEEAAMCALLHDATEAYVGDVVRPLKRQLPEYCEAEDRLMDLIFERFSVDPRWPAEVTTADSRILLDERAALLKPSPQPWAAYIEELEPLGVNIKGWTPVQAEVQYLSRFEELCFALA